MYTALIISQLKPQHCQRQQLNFVYLIDWKNVKVIIIIKCNKPTRICSTATVLFSTDNPQMIRLFIFFFRYGWLLIKAFSSTHTQRSIWTSYDISFVVFLFETCCSYKCFMSFNHSRAHFSIIFTLIYHLFFYIWLLFKCMLNYWQHTYKRTHTRTSVRCVQITALEHTYAIDLKIFKIYMKST